MWLLHQFTFILFSISIHTLWIEKNIFYFIKEISNIKFNMKRYLTKTMTVPYLVYNTYQTYLSDIYVKCSASNKCHKKTLLGFLHVQYRHLWVAYIWLHNYPLSPLVYNILLFGYLVVCSFLSYQCKKSQSFTRISFTKKIGNC